MSATPTSPCQPCASHVAQIRRLASAQGDAAILHELEALEKRVSTQLAAPPDVAGWGDLDAHSAQRERLWRGLDACAVAAIAPEKERFARLLAQRLDVLAVRGHRDRRSATREMRMLLCERLDAWRLEIERIVSEAYGARAAEFGRSGAPLAGPPHGTYLLMRHATFLDVAPLVAALTDRLATPERAWRRIREELLREGQMLLSANVARIVDAWKDRIERDIRKNV